MLLLVRIADWIHLINQCAIDDILAEFIQSSQGWVNILSDVV